MIGSNVDWLLYDAYTKWYWIDDGTYLPNIRKRGNQGRMRDCEFSFEHSTWTVN